MITTILTSIHIVVCLFLVVIVLLQHGKGADMGATFGGGSSQTVFGSEGPLPLLNKVTTGAAILFMLTSLSLAYFSSNLGRGSVMHAVKPAPAPIGGALERSPSTVPVPEGQPETAPKQFPGSEKSKEAPAKEQQPATTPVEKAAAPAAKAPASTPKAAAPAPAKETPAKTTKQSTGESKK